MIACGGEVPPADVVPIFIEDASCVNCRISINEIGLVGNDPVAPTVDAKVASDGRSVIAVAPLQGRARIGLFDLGSGTPLREIALPDGWTPLSTLDVAGDGSLAIMSEQRRRVRFISRDGSIIRDTPVPRGTHRVLISGETLVANAELRTSDGLGFPLHLVSRDGKVGLSFGSSDPTVIPREDYVWRRRLALSRSGSVWSANPDTYQLGLWDPRGGGRLLRNLVRKSSWWDAASSGANPGLFATEKPKAEVIAVWEDSTGLIWTQLKVASRTWRPITPDELARRRNAPFRLSDYDEFFETVIEVIDPARGSLLGSLHLPGAVGLLLRGNIWVKWIQTGPESYALKVSRLSLNRHAAAADSAGR